LLVQEPEIKVCNCKVSQGVMKTRTFNDGSHRRIKGLIPMAHGFFETNRTVFFNPHVILMDVDVLLEQGIILDQVQAEIDTRQDLVNFGILEEVDISGFLDQFIRGERSGDGHFGFDFSHVSFDCLHAHFFSNRNTVIAVKYEIGIANLVK